MTHRSWRATAPYLIGVAAIIVAVSGTADAAKSAVIRLGHANSANQPTTFQNKRGTSLALVGKAGSPPLKVSDGVVVPSLNASMLGGMRASQLQAPSDIVTTAGTSTTTVPAGYQHMIVIAVGGGGAGGPEAAGPGGGGGAGATAMVWTPVKPGSKWQVTVGSGGQGGSGKAGGSSFVRPDGGNVTTQLVTAAGGAAGIGGLACPSTSTDIAVGGQPTAATSKATAAGAQSLQGTPGAPGTVGQWTGACPGAQVAGVGGGGNLAGGGGAGATSSVSPSSGHAGLVVVEFLR